MQNINKENQKLSVLAFIVMDRYFTSVIYANIVLLGLSYSVVVILLVLRYIVVVVVINVVLLVLSYIVVVLLWLS